METRKALRLLQLDAEQACAEMIVARKTNPILRECRGVNWKSLHCYAVYYITPNEGAPFYEVVIRGAAPDCAQLQLWLQRELWREGSLTNVRVRTEW